MLNREETYRKQNIELLVKYPFLRPRKWLWLMKDKTENVIRDGIPEGWWKRFGEAMCDDFKEVTARNKKPRLRIEGAEEKLGTLRIYGNGPDEWKEHLRAWQYISAHTCVECGEFPVPVRDDTWVSPWCDRCFVKHEIRRQITEKEMNNETLESINSDEVQANVESHSYRKYKLEEYINTEYYDKSGNKKTVTIDMKPYYKKIGFDFKKYIKNIKKEEA